MNIVVAPDSYKGSLTSLQVAKTMRNAILEIDPDCEISMKPMADGGEGSLECLLSTTKGKKIPIICTGPLGEKMKTFYGITQSGVAVIEGANIAGLMQVPDVMRNPDVTTTYGIGEVIVDALNRGCRSFIIGIGGSATNDGGLGMMIALGMTAFDKTGMKLDGYGIDVLKVDKVDFTNFDSRLADINIKVACDVDNPLCGRKGATVVYGPQKGTTTEQIELYGQALDKYSDLIENELQVSFKNVQGAGAAGGLGFAFLTMGANLVSGAKLIAQTIQLEKVIKNADLVIAGEGQSDEQTLYGKAPGYVASIAKKHDVPVILISGSLTRNGGALRERFSGCFSIINEPLSLEQSMKNAEKLLYKQTKQIIHLIKEIKKKE